MAGELTVKHGELVTKINDEGMGELIKPLTREIHLFDTFIAGTTHLSDESVLDDVKKGDKLILRREENKFDDKAVVILYSDGRKLGYVPERDNVIFSRLMDAGKLLTAIVSKTELRGTFHQISIGIYLVDF